MTEALTAYCFKCREKRPIQDPEAVLNKRGGPATRGTCSVCGTKMYRTGRTAAHKGMRKPEPPPKVRSGNLVIVESPAKARTIGRFLGKEYKVMASIGHVRDLLRSQLSVDVDDDFRPRYRVPNEKRQVVKELRDAAQKAATIYLATDMDREGEAIAWHLMEAAEIEPERVRRVVFHEITESAIKESFARPADINMRLVDAQQARRILDRLVGYKISPLLWVRVRNRLTAGRVQSVTVRIVVEREREIKAFEPQEYWSLQVELAKQLSPEGESAQQFTANLHRVNGAQVELTKQAAVTPILQDLEKGEFQVNQVRIGQRQRKPKAPFTTSTLQQAASGRLHFRAKRTMRIAQQLYEGLDVGEGEIEGLITYMRTDSVHISAQVQQRARSWIAKNYGSDYVPDPPPEYQTKAKSAQEAHEAIRPTSVHRTPKSVKSFLNRDQKRLYDLIWRRFIASQMAPARFRTQRVDIAAGPAGGGWPYTFRASGSELEFPGFMAVDDDRRDEGPKVLPPLDKGERLRLVRLLPEQHFTQPPPRFTEATLVKTLEEHGIGRPSTYAPIITTIQQRGYVEHPPHSGNALQPTDVGILVNDLLVEHFSEVVSIGFTAEMESRLDKVAGGETEWVPVIRDFYTPFAARLAAAEKEMPEMRLEDQPVGRECPQEGCGGALVVRWGRYGKFVACENYPECKFTEPWLEKIGVACPDCGGDLVRRRTRKGRLFFGCSGYPECEFASWKQPLTAPCPLCSGLLVAKNRREALCKACGEETLQDELRV